MESAGEPHYGRRPALEGGRLLVDDPMGAKTDVRETCGKKEEAPSER